MTVDYEFVLNSDKVSRLYITSRPRCVGFE